MDRTTASTTRSNGRGFLCAAAVLIGAYLIVAGVPTLVVGHSPAHVSRIAAEVQSGAKIDPLLKESVRQILRSSSDGGQISTAGLFSILEAQDIGEASADGRVWLNRAADDLQRGVKLTPADGFAWVRLSLAKYQLSGITPAAVKALRMSLYAAHHSSRASRLQMALTNAMWSGLDEETRSVALVAISTNWKNPATRQSLETFANSADGAGILQSAIVRDPPGQRELDAWLVKIQATKAPKS